MKRIKISGRSFGGSIYTQKIVTKLLDNPKYGELIEVSISPGKVQKTVEAKFRAAFEDLQRLLVNTGSDVKLNYCFILL